MCGQPLRLDPLALQPPFGAAAPPRPQPAAPARPAAGTGPPFCRDRAGYQVSRAAPPHPARCLDLCSSPLCALPPRTPAAALRLHVARTSPPATSRLPLLLLVHGFPEAWFSWRHQMAALRGDFQVVAVDMRGYNLSSAPQVRSRRCGRGAASSCSRRRCFPATLAHLCSSSSAPLLYRCCTAGEGRVPHGAPGGRPGRPRGAPATGGGAAAGVQGGVGWARPGRFPCRHHRPHPRSLMPPLPCTGNTRTARTPAQLALVGHDWGGNVCWAAAHYAPHLFSRLAVLCAPHPRCFLPNLDWDQFKRSWCAPCLSLSHSSADCVTRADIIPPSPCNHPNATLTSPCPLGRSSLPPPHERKLCKRRYMVAFQVPWVPELAFAASDYELLRDILQRPPSGALTPGAITPEVCVCVWVGVGVGGCGCGWVVVVGGGGGQIGQIGQIGFRGGVCGGELQKRWSAASQAGRRSSAAPQPRCLCAPSGWRSQPARRRRPHRRRRTSSATSRRCPAPAPLPQRSTITERCSTRRRAAPPPRSTGGGGEAGLCVWLEVAGGDEWAGRKRPRAENAALHGCSPPPAPPDY